MRFNKTIFSNHTINQAGFTLLEMIVAVFAFSIIITIIGSVFINALSLQRRALNAQRVEENLSLIMESVAREIRVAQPPYNFSNTSCPPSEGDNSLAMTNSTGHSVVYSLSGGVINRNVDGVDGFMNSNKVVEFTKLQFCVTGNNLNINQPRITILSSIQSKDTNQQIKEDYQTTVTVRSLNR